MKALLYLDTLLEKMSEISELPFDAWFDEINSKVFNGELPKVPILLRPLRTSTGYASATRNRMTGKVTPDKIVISNYFKRNEDEMKGILAHEMIHLFHFTEGLFLSNKSSHGIHFDAKAKHAEKILGIKIPKTDIPSEIELSYRHKGKRLETILLKRKDRDTWSVAVYTLGTFKRDMERMKEDMQGISDRTGSVVEIYDTDIPEIFSLPRNKSQSNIGFYKLEAQIAEKIMKTGNLIWGCEP